MAGRPRSRTESERANRVETLTPDDLSQLRLSFWTRFDETSLADMLAVYPGRSVWMPETSEYAFVLPWRHRPEIAAIGELSAIRNPRPLVEAAERNAAAHGAHLLLMVEVEESRRPSFYERIGFQLLEEVVTYELAKIPDLSGAGQLKFTRADVASAVDLAELIFVDDASFPWVWRNSPAEFVEYSDAPGVELFIGRLEGRPVAYFGITSYLGWGHIDRVGIIPAQQGRGLGSEAVRFALRRLATSGAKKIGLSTQRSNIAAQRLYERFGFRRAVTNDYRLYGKVLSLPNGVRDLFSV